MVETDGMMPVLLMVAAFTLAFVLAWRRRPGTDPRSAFLVTALVFGVFTAVTTEVLTAFSALDRVTLAVSWGQQP